MTKRKIIVIKKTKQKKPIKKSSPKSCSDNKIASPIGSADLKQLKSTQLNMLLRLKKIPGRSKLNTKVKRANALKGLITLEDLVQIGAKCPKPLMKIQQSFEKTPEISAHHPLLQKIRPGTGIRVDVPVCGIDVHKEVLVCAIYNPHGLVREFKINNTTKDIENLILLFQTEKVELIGMESTAEYWRKPFEVLRVAGFALILANPKQTKATQGIKTDEYDARRIALAVRDGRLKPSIICTEVQFQRKKTNRDAIAFTQNATKCLQRMKTIFHQLDASKWVQELPSTQRGIRVLSQCLNSTQIGQIREIIDEEYSKGKGTLTIQNQEEKTLEIGSFISKLGQNYSTLERFGFHFNQFIQYNRQAERLRLLILQSASDDPQFLKYLNLLISIPGVGIDSAITFAVEIVNVNFFPRSKNLTKWAGIVPRINQSGLKKRNLGKIYKGGNKWLRYSAYLCAKVSYAQKANLPTPFGQHIDKLYNEKNLSYNASVIGGGRKLLTYIYHILRNEQPYEVVYKDFMTQQVKINQERKKRSLNRMLKKNTLSTSLPLVISTLANQARYYEESSQELLNYATELLSQVPLLRTV